MGDTGLQLTLRRGMRLLELLNAHAILSASEASRLSQLPRPTTYRLLRALEQLGYVEQDPASKRYTLTSAVLRLSRGFRDERWIQAVARPAMDDLCRNVLWPVSVCTQLNDQMLVRYSTDHLSPFPSIRRNSAFAISLTGTASGNVFLAFTNAKMRNALIAAAEARKTPEAKAADKERIAEDRGYVMEQEFKRIRRLGYGSMQLVNSKQASLAIPVYLNDAAYAVLSLRYYKSAMTEAEAVKRYVPMLKDVARKIEKDLARTPGLADA